MGASTSTVLDRSNHYSEMTIQQAVDDAIAADGRNPSDIVSRTTSIRRSVYVTATNTALPFYAVGCASLLNCAGVIYADTATNHGRKVVCLGALAWMNTFMTVYVTFKLGDIRLELIQAAAHK